MYWPVPVAELRTVNIRRTIGLAISVFLAILVFFEVTFPFDISSSYETKVPDPAVEADYERCYQEKDKEMHRRVFATVDNPDVQKEYISTNREQIARECREQFAERLITVRQPSRFNLVDLKPRFW
jgi:hypothetical protein